MLAQSKIEKLESENEVFRAVFHYLHTHAQITMNYEKVTEMMSAISAWSYAHRCGNGEYSDEEQQELVDRTFERIRKMVGI